MSEFYDTAPPAAIERLARIEGQSNFLSILAGIEAGPDTTQDMAALGFSRARGAIPEVLEAHVAKTAMFKLPLMSFVFRRICAQLKPKQKEWPWIQGAVADAFLELKNGECKPSAVRAKRFKVREETYRAMRSAATHVFNEILADATREWKRSRFREGEIPSNGHSVVTPRTFCERASIGMYVQPSLASGPEISDSHVAPIDTHGVGMTDRLGWDERNAAPGQVTTLQAQPTANVLGPSPK